MKKLKNTISISLVCSFIVACSSGGGDDSPPMEGGNDDDPIVELTQCC